MKDIINILDKYELHDAPLEEVLIDLEKNRIIVKLSIHNEEIDDYYQLHLVFLEIKDLKIQNIGELIVECLNHYKILRIGENYNISLVFLLGFSKPTWELNFIFSDLELNFTGKLPSTKSS